LDPKLTLNKLFLYSRQSDMAAILENIIPNNAENKISALVKAGNVEGLDLIVTKWGLQYDKLTVENKPLFHLAVASSQLLMMKFLMLQGVDIFAYDMVRQI
jgi:hypothetical protein